MRKMVFLSGSLLASLFVGCAAEIEVVDDRTGINQQFVEGSACIEASLPANGCIDYSTVKTQVYDICLQADMQLTGIMVDPNGNCNNGNGTNGAVEYQCCPAAPPTPPPPKPPPVESGVCTSGTIGDGTCQSYVDFKMAATESCNQAGSALFDLVVDDGTCAAGEAASAAYTCCAPAPTPPPVPGVCTNGTFGDGTCQDYGDWKTIAWEACNQAGATLIDVVLDTGTCTNGEVVSMTYTCISSGDYCP